MDTLKLSISISNLHCWRQSGDGTVEPQWISRSVISIQIPKCPSSLGSFFVVGTRTVNKLHPSYFGSRTGSSGTSVSLSGTTLIQKNCHLKFNKIKTVNIRIHRFTHRSCSEQNCFFKTYIRTRTNIAGEQTIPLQLCEVRQSAYYLRGHHAISYCGWVWMGGFVGWINTIKDQLYQRLIVLSWYHTLGYIYSVDCFHSFRLLMLVNAGDLWWHVRNQQQ